LISGGASPRIQKKISGARKAPVTTSEADYYRLRTEWLRFKSHLYDALTGLPALAAVVEDVRRLLETRGSADVVYVDLGRSGWHETKAGWAAHDEAVQAFAQLLLSLRETGDLSPQDIVCLHSVRSDRFLFFLAGGKDAPKEGKNSPRERLLAALRRRMGASPAKHVLKGLRPASGHSRIVEDPMIRSERGIQQAVSDAMLASLVEQETIETARRGVLARIIARKKIRAVFHPIVQLADGAIVGHEALTRPLEEIPFDSVEELFVFAESTDLLMDFERLCRATAVGSAARLKNRGLLFLNASAQAIEDPDWTNGVMDQWLGKSGLTPRDVVVEITERVAIVRHDAFREALKGFKERGYRLAVDDMGAGYASFQALASIEPEFLKFDVSLVRDIDQSSIKRSLLGSLKALADKIRARVIAEGVEREGELATLLALGIELGQGFHFKREEP
jgi:EAL domain-containing protein (putative c-di-GMP-specific phosphodiesterase class I)